MPAVSETHYEFIRDAIFDNDRIRMTELLAVPGVDVDHLDAGGQTLLHLACFWGRMELTKLLLAAGASLKTKNAAGCTALDLATHWGHSAVAEVIRLRGGSSVWEDKLGSLQVELQDLSLQAQHLEMQNTDKRRRLETMTQELQSVQTQLDEEKSGHALTRASLERIRRQLVIQTDAAQQLQHDKANLLDQLKESRVALGDAQRASTGIREDLTAMKAHRDDVLVQMQVSVRQQEEATHNWQRAEIAAAISDSQRNFAFAERDQRHRAQLATLAELLVTTERLGAAEDELMTLKTDLAEHIFDMKREKRNRKHATQAQASCCEDKLLQGRHRPNTVEITKARTAEDVQELLQVARATPKKMFSLAAREYRDRVSRQEHKKRRGRGQQQQKVENQYRAHGFRAPVVDAEVFQDEFVSTIRAFASSRSDKWLHLKRERARQARVAATTLARPISTAPLLVDSVSGSEGTLDFSLYRKYALPLPQTDEAGALRPATSCMELRRHADFLCEMRQKTASYPQIEEEPTSGQVDKLGAFLPMV